MRIKMNKLFLLLCLLVSLTLLPQCTDDATKAVDGNKTEDTSPSAGSGTDIGNPDMPELETISSYLPEDTTNQNSYLTIKFISPTNMVSPKLSTENPSKLNLVAQPDTPIELNDVEHVKVSENIFVTDARINLTSIRLGTKTSPPTKLLANYRYLKTLEKNLFQILRDLYKSPLQSFKLKNFDTAMGKRFEEINNKQEIRNYMIKKLTELRNRQAKILTKIQEIDPSVRFKGPYIFNLLNNTTNPSLDEITIPNGTYRRIDFFTKFSVSLEVDDPMYGKSLYVNGLYVEDEDNTYYFQITYDAMKVLTMVSENGFFLTEDVHNTINIAFDLEKWFKDIDFSQATKNDNIIIVNRENNLEVLRQLYFNIRSELRFGRDKDNDGTLSDDEQDGKGAVNEADGAIILDE